MIWVLASFGVSVQSATFINTAPIAVSLGGPASPYPSGITVAGISGQVTRVSVTLKNISHEYPDDLDVLLVSPDERMVLLMSDAGGGNFIEDIHLTFARGTGAMLPDNSRITGGAYDPTDFEAGDSFPASAPPGPYGTDLTVFNGTDPLGVWQLYVYDDATFHGGGVIAGGWELTIELGSSPEITSHPENQTVSPGGTANFDVTVTGTPPLGYQWLRNGQVFVPFSSGTASLTITNVQATHAGTYAVVVTNSANPAGVMSSNALLNVLGPLTLVEAPTNQTVNPGETVFFQVTAAGTPPVFYQWRLNGALLPGQTNSTLTLSNVQATSGGAFSVTVYDGDEVFTTAPAVVVVNAATAPPPKDDFDDRPQLEGLRGVLQGDSSRAATERDEPVLPGGGKTVWSEWLAPADGIVTLAAQGSAFDTLLGVFTGTTLSNLTLVTMDDDQGGFYTSRVRFNARKGEVYQWMLDGFGFEGVGGKFALTWLLEPGDKQVPVIISAPQPQGVQSGSNATFSVITESPHDQYQWLFNDTPIPGATGSAHAVSNVLSEDVGFYSVLVSNASGFAVQSPRASLQRGYLTGLLAEDNVHYINNRPGQGIPISVGLGEIGWNEFASDADGGAADPDPCDHPFFKTLFQSVHAEDTGVIQIDTIESEVYVFLGIYQGVPTGLTNLDVLVACDVASGPASQPCLAHFTAAQGSNYTAVVAALQGNGTETIRITATMGSAPPITQSPDFCLIPPGGSILLAMPATNWVPVPNCQWRLNDQDIPDATNTTLLVTNFSLMQEGAYSVVMSNFAGAATNIVAQLELAGPLMLGHSVTTASGTSGFVITASNAAPFLLVTKTNLDPAIPWEPLFTNQESCQTFFFTNANMLADPLRFFRGIPWPPQP